jgi:hypothetical protein
MLMKWIPLKSSFISQGQFLWMAELFCLNVLSSGKWPSEASTKVMEIGQEYFHRLEYLMIEGDAKADALQLARIRARIFWDVSQKMQCPGNLWKAFSLIYRIGFSCFYDRLPSCGRWASVKIGLDVPLLFELWFHNPVRKISQITPGRLRCKHIPFRQWCQL